jgi:hypothetical protein
LQVSASLSHPDIFTSKEFSCPTGFHGSRCESNLCEQKNCQNNGKCVLENSRAICSCRKGFTGPNCQSRLGLQWHTWVMALFACGILVFVLYGFIRYNSKIIRLKYLFAHHRLHEQIGLEANSSHAMYSHLPMQDHHNHDQSLEDVLADEIDVPTSSNHSNNRSDDFADDPFYVDEKQPIFSGEHLNGRSSNTGIL